MHDSKLTYEINKALEPHRAADARPHVVLIDPSGSGSGPFPRVAFRRGNVVCLAYRAGDAPSADGIVRLLLDAGIAGGVNVSVIDAEVREHSPRGSSNSTGCS